MTQRSPSKRLAPGLILLIAALLMAGFIWNADTQALAYLQTSLKQIQNIQKKGDQNAAASQLRQLIAQPPTVYLKTSQRTVIIDQARAQLAQLYLRQGQDAMATKTLAEITSDEIKPNAEALRAELDAKPRLLEADRLAAQGRWLDAEQLYLKHLGNNKTSLPHRLTFHRILIRQGRAALARQIYADGVFSLDLPEDGLASLWIMDVEEPVIGDWTASVEQAAELAPTDPRVQLAQAFLARSAGHFAEAHLKLNSIANKMPDDQAVRAELLQLAIAEVNATAAQKAATGWKCSQQEALQFAAWLEQKADSKSKESATLKKLVELNPSDRPALSRLAEIAARENRPNDAAEFQRLKREAEDRRIQYTRLCRQSSPFNAQIGQELAVTAGKLGLKFEQWAWAQMAAQKPLDPAQKPPVEIKPWQDWLESSAQPDGINLADNATAPELQPASVIAFEDIAEKSGLARFVHRNGAPASKLIPPLSSAGGVGLIDFDNDGLQDIYAVQSGSFPPDFNNARCADKLYRNLGNNRFEDATEKSGINQFPGGYGHGVAVGDIDNDGFSDILVTRWRRYALYRNRGNGTFEDVTEKYGLAGERDWPTSAAFADLDNDGDLDLYVAHYMEWIEGKTYPCIDPTKPNTYDCRPRDFPAMKDHLFRNDGGKFTDISDSAGISAADVEGRGLGVVAADFNSDGLMDLFVANDTTSNFLFLNKGGLKFEESADTAGVAANAQGGYQAGMGPAVADINGDGLMDLAVTNFYNESTTIFLNLGGGLFADRTAAFGVAAPSRFLLGFGITLDGNVADSRPAIPWRMPLQVMQGRDVAGANSNSKNSAIRSNRLVDVSATAGPAFTRELMARGLASGDLDNDGRVDTVVQSQNDPLLHLHNKSTGQGHWLAIKLVGSKSNRDGVGCQITVKCNGFEKTAWRTGGGSFQAAGDGRLHFGLGQATMVQELEVRWPSGTVDRLQTIKANQQISVQEGKGQR